MSSKLEIDAVYKSQPYLIRKKPRGLEDDLEWEQPRGQWWRRTPEQKVPGRPPGSLSGEEIAITQETIDTNKKRLEEMRAEGRTGKVWLAVLDNKTCSGCRELHGKCIPIGDVFSARGITVEVPSLHPSCRCQVVACDL